MLDTNKLDRYGQLGQLLIKYGRRDFLDAVNAEFSDSIEPLDSAVEGGRGPEDLVADLTALGPTFVKLGQMLSTRSDLISEPYLGALSALQDDVPGVDFTTIDQVLTEELGAKPSRLFASLDEAPLAAASLAQVHRATLRGGREVVVKVQRPGIQEQILEDLEILESISGAIDRRTEFGRQYETSRLVLEFRNALLAELDYRQEAQNLIAIGDMLRDEDRIVVPEPVSDLVTARVLVMDFIAGRSLNALSPLGRMEADVEPLADVLCESYFRQVLVGGLFHCDPHPGNVLVTPDNRLALIDMGMVAHVEADLRDRLLGVLLALSEGRGRDVGELALELGEPRADADVQRFIDETADLVTRRERQPARERKLGEILLSMVSIFATNGIRPPAEISLLGKTLLLLDEVARMLNPDFDPDAVFDRYAHKVMQQQLLSGLSPNEVMGKLLEVRRLSHRTPRQIESILDALSRGQFRLRVETIDETRFLTSLERIGNRIALGVVLSALIIGGALMIRVDTPWTLLGYPALAIVLFLAAAILAFGLVGQIIVAERREGKERRDH